MTDATNNDEVTWQPRTRENYLSKTKVYKLSVSQGGRVVTLNELLWSEFQTCSPDGKMEAAVFGEDQHGNILIRVGKVTDALAEPIKVAKTNRWARFRGSLGFIPAEIPQLRGKTTYFDVRKVAMKSGGYCLQVLIRSASPTPKS